MYQIIFRILVALCVCITPFIQADSDFDSGSCHSSSDSDSGFCRSHDSHRTNNTFGPNIEFAMTPFRLTDDSIISLVAEGGSKNARFSGTFGYFVTNKHHLKFTVEQLNQKMNYDFTSGKNSFWMHQFAVGGVFGYQLCTPWVESAQIRATYSHCSGKKLKPKFCCVDRTQLQTIVHRHLAGGSDGFLGVGMTATPWKFLKLSLEADYDQVYYHCKLQCKKRVSGFGGSIKLNQKLFNNSNLDLKAEMRRPFSYYEAALNSTFMHKYGTLRLGLYAGYTNGHSNLPNSWTSGILISADFGGMPFYSCLHNCSPPPCLRGCIVNPCFAVDQELAEWVATPAVRSPSVLAVSEQWIHRTDLPCPPPPVPPRPPTPPPCSPPISVTIPEQNSLPFDTSPFFDRKGLPMVFSAEGLPRDVFIDPISGIIHGNIERIGRILVWVKGTTSCGETSQLVKFFNQNPYDPYDAYNSNDPYHVNDPYHSNENIVDNR